MRTLLSSCELARRARIRNYFIFLATPSADQMRHFARITVVMFSVEV